EGSSEAVSALARHQSHGDSAMQAVVEQAAERLRETAPEPTPESAQLPEESTPQAQEQPTETEAAAESASAAVEEDMLTGLARAELAVAPESYVQLLSSAPSDQRPDAVRLLWQVAGRAVIPQIHAFLEDPSAQVRLAALEVLGESGEPDAAEVARTVLERDSS